MKKHFNLYYLLFEDCLKKQMSKEARERIWKSIASIFKKDREKPKLLEAGEENQ